MTYLGRPSAVAPIYLLLRDFSVAKDPDVLAQAAQGVSSYANAPDGTVAAAVIGGRAVALGSREESHGALADNVTTLTFGWDAETSVRGAHHAGTAGTTWPRSWRSTLRVATPGSSPPSTTRTR